MTSSAAMKNSPWPDIERPTSDSIVAARRVSAGHHWDFFWSVDHDGHCVLLLRHSNDSSPKQRLPKLRNVEVHVAEYSATTSVLVVKLLDAAQRDLFLTLCLDIIDAAETKSEEKAAVAVAVARTWRWHYLLRGGADRRLSPEEQKGLIGELLTLRDLVLPVLSPRESVLSWQGPFGSAQDFRIGNVAIETKASRGRGSRTISVSSEYQLEPAGLHALFLHVVELDSTTADDEQSLTVTSLALELRATIEAGDVSVIPEYLHRLEAAGLRPEDDYSDSNWTILGSMVARVSEQFPRIGVSTLQPGISSVTYVATISECQRFAVSSEEVKQALGRA
jgi:hypothetical protein